MLLEQHLLQLFGNLPYLPKTEITKHLEELDLIKAFLVSENWDKAVECHQKLKNRKIFLSMRSKHDHIELDVSIFSYSEMKEILIVFPVESALENSTEIVEYEERVICRSENFADFENRVLTIFHKIRSWFDVDTRHVTVNLDFGFNLEFLKKLGLEKFGSFVLSGDKKHHQIDGKELSDLMDTWEIEGCVRIRIETIGKFKGNSEMVRGSCEFDDSRWITSEMFDTFDGMCAIFKRCLLSSEDFNRFFKKWKKKCDYIHSLECLMEHELDVEKVLEGLEAKKWNPKERGRAFRHLREDTFIDLADGMDISRSDGKLATIHISADKKVIRFYQWSERFPLQKSKKHFTTMIDLLKPELEQFVWSPRKLAKIAKEVEDYEAKLQAVNQHIDRENKLSMN